jgi:hypothetical protein
MLWLQLGATLDLPPDRALSYIVTPDRRRRRIGMNSFESLHLKSSICACGVNHEPRHANTLALPDGCRFFDDVADVNRTTDKPDKLAPLHVRSHAQETASYPLKRLPY